MSKAFSVTFRKKVMFCDTDECPFAARVKVGKKYSTIYCGALGKRIRWSAAVDLPPRCPRGKKA